MSFIRNDSLLTSHSDVQVPSPHIWLLPQSSSLSQSLSQIECSQMYPGGQYNPESQVKQITPPEHTPYGTGTKQYGDIYI